MKVVFIFEIEEDLYQLIKVLVEKECLGADPSTIFYVEELVADIWQNIHSKQKKASRFYNHVFGQYIYYITYQRNSNTTWYIFFSVIGDTYFIKYITNNHVSGQYIFQHISMNMLITGIHVFMGTILLLSEKGRRWFYFLFE